MQAVRAEMAAGAGAPHIDLDPAVHDIATLFLTIPRPDVDSHPVFKRQRSRPPLLAIPEDAAPPGESPLMTDLASTVLRRTSSFASESPASPPRPLLAERFGSGDCGGSPFCEDAPAFEAVPPAVPRCARAAPLDGAHSQPLPSLDRILPPDVDVMLKRRDPSRPAIRLKRRSASHRRAAPRTQDSPPRIVRRTVTWSGARGGGDSSDSGASHSAHGAREVWSEHTSQLASQLMPGSLAFHQHLPMYALRDEGSTPAGGVEEVVATGPPKRTRSQPASELDTILAAGPPIRRSASLHSLRSSSAISQPDKLLDV